MMWLRFWAFLDWCFFGPASTRPGLVALLVRILRYPYAVIRDLARGAINLRAMGLVYTTLLSLIPLLAFTFAILKVFGAHRDLQPVVYEFFRPVGGNAATELTTRVLQFADRVSSGLVGTVGFALLAWTLLGTIKKVEDSFNFLWRVDHPRSFARRVAEYLALLVIGPILLVGFVGLSNAALGGVEGLASLRPVASTMIVLAPYVMVSAIFTLLYMFIPNTRVRWRPAVIGALAAGVLWAASGKMFTSFVVYSTRLHIVYAGFAFIVAALLWTYFGWLILLAGAQLSFYIQNPSYLRLGLEELRLSCIELEQLSLKIMYFIARAYLTGTQRWTVNGLANELGLPGIAIAQMATTLERAGLVMVTEDDELVPARDIGRITVVEILDIARNQRSGHFAPRHLTIPAVDRLLAAIDEARRTPCDEITLRELVEEPQRIALSIAGNRHLGH
jgi:membrane protein